MEITVPTYIKIMKNIKQEIVSGELKPNQKIDSIKELAKIYCVNPNTVQRALGNLEKEGLLRSRRTAGKFVTDNRLLIQSIRNREARRVTSEFVSNIEKLGIHAEELSNLFIR